MSNVKKIIVTGGSGFIGSAVIRHLLAHNDCQVMNLDKMTYAANPMTTQAFEKNERYSFLQADICDTALMTKVLDDYQPDGIMHLAAESHVDRSIDFSEDFIRTNILGTHVLLEAARAYYAKQTCERQAQFRFHHISTDEVFGSLSETDDMFTESTKYAPNSPYSASKAASDHLVRAWNKTYGLPVVMSNCSNNYGPYQFPEKLIPFMIQRALAGESLSVYGDGQNIRDWLYVDDHASALVKIFEQGQLGESYNVGGINEIRNIDVVHHICDILDQLKPAAKSYKEQVVFVKDRPGHDFRYAIDTSKIANELNWSPIETFETGIQKTIEWYLNNDAWCQLASEQYQGQRLGVSD